MTNPLTELADRCERAGADEQRELLIEAFRIVKGPCPTVRQVRQPDGSFWPGDGLGPYTDKYKEWSATSNRFNRMLDAEAYESAALMLVPNWLFPMIDGTSNSVKLVNAIGLAIRGDNHASQGQTLALALCASALRAISKEPHHDRCT